MHIFPTYVQSSGELDFDSNSEEKMNKGICVYNWYSKSIVAAPGFGENGAQGRALLSP